MECAACFIPQSLTMRLPAKNGFNNYSAFFRALIIFYLVLVGGLMALLILFNQYNHALNRDFALVSQTRTLIECIDSMDLLSQNLVDKSSDSLTQNSNTYHLNVSILDSLQKKADRLQLLMKGDSSMDLNAKSLRKQLIQLASFTAHPFQPATASANVVSRSNGRQVEALKTAITQEIQSIRAKQTRLLAARRASFIKTVNTTGRIFAISNILMLAILLASFVFILYHFKRRQKTERKLVESENRFRTLINSTKDLAIFMVDKDGIILSWYEGAHNIKGYTSGEIIGKHISIFYLPEAVAEGAPERNLQLAAGQGTLEIQDWRVRKDGSAFWADVLITAIYDDNGKVKGFTKVTRDFSLHKKAEDESRKALEKQKELNEIKSNFVSMASHEFRTPLSTILSSVSLMEFYTTTETQDKRDKHIYRIKMAINEMVATLEEFLSLEKIEEGKAQVKNALFNIRQLAENIRLKFNADLKTGQVIEYRHEGSEDIYLDENYLNHILTNLLSNAIKYSPENTLISFNTCVENSKITLTVKDEGIGISDEDQKHLFERFFRASNTGSIKGTGLGLHIVKRYVELLGGTINVKSVINEGTEFTVIF
jgi:PAS domain S-box-containing protein